MRKLLGLLLTIIVVATLCCSLFACNKDDEVDTSYDMRLTVLSDFHIIDDSFFTADNYSYYASRDKMVNFAEAIAASAIDEVIAAADSDYILVTGDIVERGDPRSLYAAASIFERAENAGIEVFVINGNHDLSEDEYRTDAALPDDFKSIFADFGYSQAVSVHDESMSYSANLGEKYRLIAIDDTQYYTAPETVIVQPIDSTLEWVSAQLASCAADDKIPIVMTHEPMVNHIAQYATLFGLRQTDRQLLLAALLAENNVKHVYTGHMHNQDVQTYTSSTGKSFVDIESASTAIYPMAYRHATYSNGSVTLTGRRVQSINVNYLPLLATVEERSAIANAAEYAADEFNGYLRGVLDGVLESAGTDDLGNLLAYLFENVVLKLFDTPIYITGENSTNPYSLERFCQEYGRETPSGNYTVFGDLPAFFIGQLNGGDENMAATAEYNMLKNGVYLAFYYLYSSQELILDYVDGAPQVDIDFATFEETGFLELYDSNVAALIFMLLGEDIPSVLAGLQTDLSLLSSDLVKELVDGFIPGAGAKIISCVSADKHSLNLDKLVFEVAIGELFADLITDTAPADNSLTIQLK